MVLVLSPAYGRDYKSAKAALSDWDANLDFIIENFGHPYAGKPMNKEQVTGETINIRYDSMRKVCVPKGE